MYFREKQVSKLRTLEEIEKASDDFPPRLEMDPILDILKEADEKLITIKATKKGTTKSKKEKVSKKKGLKSKKAMNSKENKDENQPAAKKPPSKDEDSKPKKKSKKAIKGKKSRPKKAKVERKKNNISQRISNALRLSQINTFPDDQLLQVIRFGVFLAMTC